jgi:alpha-amylase/alpha-mannosidase (GH57 family)
VTDRNRKLNLILCWHMHQPDYRNYMTGEFELPWTYLHAMKDYTDMASHLEQNPEATAVFNFVPVLLDQLEVYARAFEQGHVPDPLLRLLQHENFDELTVEQRDLIVDSCFRCNHLNMIEPYPRFTHLYQIFKLLEEQGEGSFQYLSGKYLSDLLVWYHLVWTGESVRRQNQLVIRLMTKGRGFTYEERCELFKLIGELISGLIPRYRKLQEAGRIELSTTPHYHPIGPLLIDLHAARESQPDTSLPKAQVYPGGRSRMEFHIQSAYETHMQRFGTAPSGYWPAEGGVSNRMLELLAEHPVKWTATGEAVLANSLHKAHPAGSSPDRNQYLYRPYHLEGKAKDVACFFRDDRLSDLIGFEYAKWHGSDAVANFVHQLKDILTHTPGHEDPVVSVILDGENAWEYYPYNGHFFLSGLYEALANDPDIHLTTFSRYLAECNKDQAHCAKPATLPGLVAGSWVYGTFSTWIGSPDKNRAWDLLCAAKQSYDLVMASQRLSDQERAAAERQLCDCESSDWFWWFGDYNPQHSVESFDRLYRENLANLYALLKLPVPDVLSQPLSRGGGHAEAGGTMRRSS